VFYYLCVSSREYLCVFIFCLYAFVWIYFVSFFWVLVCFPVCLARYAHWASGHTFLEQQATAYIASWLLCHCFLSLMHLQVHRRPHGAPGVSWLVDSGVLAGQIGRLHPTTLRLSEALSILLFSASGQNMLFWKGNHPMFRSSGLFIISFNFFFRWASGNTSQSIRVLPNSEDRRLHFGSLCQQSSASAKDIKMGSATVAKRPLASKRGAVRAAKESKQTFRAVQRSIIAMFQGAKAFEMPLYLFIILMSFSSSVCICCMPLVCGAGIVTILLARSLPKTSQRKKRNTCIPLFQEPKLVGGSLKAHSKCKRTGAANGAFILSHFSFNVYEKK
jgi:hypothetical protein